jgi:hypothetical protein
MRKILVCCTSARDRDYWISRAVDDGGKFVPPSASRGPQVIFARLELELMFLVFERGVNGRSQADRLRGLNLAGVLEFETVADEEIRSIILARLRP